MAASTKVIAIGNSAGIILPKETLERLNVRKGDSLYLQETPSGLQVTPYDSEFESKIEVAESMIRRYRDTFKKLAE